MKKRSLKMILMIVLVVTAFTAIVMLLWNALLPSLFGLATINFWQAAGILILARILFGSFGRNGMMMGGMMMHHRNPIHDKWQKMSPEERKEFISRRREFGFGGGGPFGRDDFFGGRRGGHHTNNREADQEHD